MDKDSSEVQRLSGQYRQLKQEMDVLKADMIHLKSWLIKNKCYEATDNCETVDEKVDITTEVAELEERMIELTLHISQKDTLIVELKESLENARNKIKDLEMNLENTRDKIQDLESILEEKTKETISLTADLVSKDKKLSRALEHINEIEKEKAELQATLESKFRELESMKSDYGNYTNFVKHGQEQNGIFYSDGEDAVEEIEVNEVEDIEINVVEEIEGKKVEETDLNKVHNIEEVDEVVEIVLNESIKRDNKPSEQSFEDAKGLEGKENDNLVSCEVINESDDYFEMESYLEPEVVVVEYDCQEVNVKESEASIHEETLLNIEENSKEYDSSSQDFDSSSLEEKLHDEKVKAKRIKEDYNTSSLSEFESTKQYEEPIIPGLKHTVSGACRLGLWNPCIQSLEEKLQPYSSAYEQFLTVKDCPNFLSMAAEQGLDDLIAVLLANGMSPNQTVDRLGTVLLHTAVKGYHKPLVLLLLKKGASTEKRDCSKKTPLHYATEYGYFDISKILIDNNANINVKDECGKTPLHHAAVSGTEELIELLLCDNRCDKDVIDVFGRKAFDYTYQKEHIMRIFKKY